MNEPTRREPLPPGRVIFLGALFTGILSVFPGMGIFCSCFFGFAGLLGGWSALRLYFRSGGIPDLGRAAWLGLYGAALGTLAAMALHVLMGDFTLTHEDFQTLMGQMKDYLVKNGTSPAEVEKQVRALRPAMEAGFRWLPLVLVFLNGAGGAAGGALASLFAAAKRKDPRGGGEDQDPSGGSSSRMDT